MIMITSKIIKGIHDENEEEELEPVSEERKEESVPPALDETELSAFCRRFSRYEEPLTPELPTELLPELVPELLPAEVFDEELTAGELYEG